MQTSKTKTIVGWVLSVLIGLFLIGASGLPKFLVDWPGKEEMMARLGIPLDLLLTIGLIEIGVAVLYLIPPTAFLGAILTTGYLGGAVFTHLRIGDGLFETLFPVILGVILWTGLALRKPVLFSLLPGASPDRRRQPEET
ncbi:DoxX family protein [Lignipirellula cremea]|uniref:DoxX-like family protein n=1 Tax=Lignipirellula cremea TaxID=2528010 RepID=A0A518DY39_9BACT|nr:DoxX family protein [Lignipirellula cremea]QDU96763.1 hypothetical protein Pla8534_45840 [Lignipirellula cremea]